jgi:hypothetical protein
MKTLTDIEKLILEEDTPSAQLLNQYLSGSKDVTYEQIVRACRKERLAFVLNKACLGKTWLMPLMFIPVLVFCLAEE